MIVTFEEDGVSKISEYSDHKPDYDIISSLHKHNVRQQMLTEFKKLCGKDPSDNTIGYALEELSKKRFYSKIERIGFHYGKTLKNFGVKFT